jgi:tetratricopeptide (TPR) repeat protein
MADEFKGPKGPIGESEEIVSLGQRTMVWATRNASILAYSGGAILFIAILASGFLLVQSNRSESANMALTDAVNLLQPLAERQGEAPAAAPPERQREALEAFREVADKFPSMPQGKTATLYAANVLFNLGSYQDAARVIEELRSNDAGFVKRYDGLYLLAKAYEAANNHSRAIAVYGEALERATGEMRGQVLLDMGRCWTLSGDRARAAESYQKVLAEFPPENPLAQRADKMLVLLGTGASASR